MKRGRPLGYRESEETKRKRSETMKGHPVSDKTKKKISNAKNKKAGRDDLNVDLIGRLYDKGMVRVADIADLFDISVPYLLKLMKERKR